MWVIRGRPRANGESRRAYNFLLGVAPGLHLPSPSSLYFPEQQAMAIAIQPITTAPTADANTARGDRQAHREATSHVDDALFASNPKSASDLRGTAIMQERPAWA